MKWKGRRASGNVVDRRGSPVKGIAGGGIGTIVIIILIMLLGGNPSSVIDLSQIQGPDPSIPYVASAEEEELAQFAAVVLAETEDTWVALLEQEGIAYEYPKLVLYTGRVDSACGVAGSSTGPFYCSGDQSVYIDLSFFLEMEEKLNASGDFAMAYVIAHEVGHHIQNILGTMDQVMEMRSKVDEVEFNRYMVRLELQADYYAGVWAHYADKDNLLEEGDIDEAINAASAVGDDRLQQQAYGYVVPDSFTHGTSAQRQQWFKKGYLAGTLANGDTFSVNDSEL
jgi:hypothetical protein